MQRRLLYIINPISGRRNKQTLEELIQTETKKAGFYFEPVTNAWHVIKGMFWHGIFYI